MIIIGLTGSMAMGKSTAADMLSSIDGVAVHCSDDVVKDLYNNPEVIDLVKTTFPGSFNKKENGIDKEKLIDLLGTDHERWNALEDILHPYVIASQKKFIREHQALGTDIVVLDIPLLFETGAESRVDYVVCVSASPVIQRQRIRQRISSGAVTEEDAAFRLERQMPDNEKTKRADFVVQTGQSRADMRRDLENIIRNIKKKT